MHNLVANADNRTWSPRVGSIHLQAILEMVLLCFLVQQDSFHFCEDGFCSDSHFHMPIFRSHLFVRRSCPLATCSAWSFLQGLL